MPRPRVFRSGLEQVAQELDIITTAQYDVLRGEDQEAKITTIAELTTDNALSLISGYQNMPEF